MRIERAEHAADGAVDEAVGLDLVDVVRLDRAQRRGEGLVVLRHLVVGRQRASAEEAADQRGHDDREDDGGQGAVASHDQASLADNFLTGNDFWALPDAEFLDPFAGRFL